METNKLIIEPKPNKGEDGHSTFSIRIKNELLSDIQNISNISGYSRNQLISLLLEFAVKNCEISNHSDETTL